MSKNWILTKPPFRIFATKKLNIFQNFDAFLSIYFLDKNTHLTHRAKETKWPFMQTQKIHFWEAVFNLSFYRFRGKPKMITFTKKTPIFDPFYFRIVSRVDWQDLLFIPTVSKSSESCKKCESTDAAQCLKFTLKRLIWWK